MALLRPTNHAQRPPALGVGGGILIVSHHSDVSAIAIQVALEQRGVTVHYLPINLFPFCGEHSFKFTQNGSSAGVTHPEQFRLENLDGIWFRRRAPTRAFDYAKPWTDEDFRRRTLSAYTLSLYEFLQARHPDTHWINDPAAASRANSKLVQLHLAPGCGLTIPDTLVSNSPTEIRDFLSDHAGEVVVKSLIPYTISGDGRTKQIMTVKVPAGAQFHDEALSGQVSIYQVYAEKSFEVRLLIFGDHAFGLKINSVKNGEQTVDWRTMSPSKEHFSALQVPDSILQACKDLMANLGIVFGCFDFIVTPDGDFIFLEVNESGDFLWMEECVPEYRILSQFSAWLANKPLGPEAPDLGILEIVKSKRFRQIKAELHDHAQQEPDHSVKVPV